MPDHSIPMEGRTAQIPEQRLSPVNAQIPMSVEPFKAIDPMAVEQRATNLAMDQNALQQQKEAQASMAADRTKLAAFNEAGGNLHTVEGLDEALNQGGWSQKTVDGLLSRKEAIQKNSIEFQKALRTEDAAKVEQMHGVMQDTLKRASVPTDRYQKALADGKDPTAAAKIFNTEIQALITEERANIDPATGKPRMTADKLDAMAKMSPQDWAEKVKESDYKVKQVALDLARRKTEADIKKSEAISERELSVAEMNARKPAGGTEKIPSGYRPAKDGSGELEFIPGGPADPAKKESAMTGRESVFINRVLLSANEAAKDLGNVVRLPISSTTGFFGGRSQGGSLMDAGKESLANKMTSQEVQSYNVFATGFQRSLASIEAAGLMPTGQLSHQMDSIIFREGDTNLTKLQKLAQTRQIIEAGLETTLSNKRVPEEARKHIQEVLSSIKKSVPFTQSELLDLTAAQEENPDMTLAEVIKNRRASAPAESPKPTGSAAGYTNTPKGEMAADTGQILRQELTKARADLATAKTPEEKARAQGDIDGLQRELKIKPAGGGAPRKVSNDAEYEAVPSGATYTAPDGSVRRKK